MLVLTAPDRKRCSPESITRERPINIVLKPVTVSTSFNCLWVPIGLLILSDKCVFRTAGVCREPREI
jgi:hypothetical protein